MSAFKHINSLPRNSVAILFFLIFGCVVSQPFIKEEGEVQTFSDLKVKNAANQKWNINDPFFQNYNQQDTVPRLRGGEVSVMDFGAKCDGIADDIIADSTACAYCIAHPFFCSTISFPVGHSRISRPLLLQNNGHYFTIHLKGMLPAKEASDQYLSEIICDYKAGYGIGIQSGRGIILENLAILGKYTFPYSVTNSNIGTLLFSQWIDKTISDSRYAPYAGIVIDPFANASGASGGTSGVEIRQCAIKQWMVGICLSPQNTVNDEMINIIDDDIEANRVAIAIGQDQSKEIHIDRLKCWASTHTIIDGVSYGRGTGGGSVDMEGGNIAGNVNQLLNVILDRFPMSIKDIYSESLFRIGSVGNGAGANFINTQINFLTGDGLPSADYIISGQANFYGGSLRYYDGSPTHRLNLSNIGSWFRDMTMNTQPITIGLYGYPSNVYPVPYFENVHNYYRGGKIVNGSTDSLIPLHNISYGFSDSVKWVAVYYGKGLGSISRKGDYILGAPQNTSGWHHDRAQNAEHCATIKLGRVVKISADSLYLDDVGLNAPATRSFDAIYIDRLK